MTNTPDNTIPMHVQTTQIPMDGWHGVFLEGQQGPVATFSDQPAAHTYALALQMQGHKASVGPFLLDVAEIRPATPEDRILANQEAMLSLQEQIADLMPDSLERAVLAAAQGLAATGYNDAQEIAQQALAIGKALNKALDEAYPD